MNILLGIPVCHADAFNDCPIWLGDHADLAQRATPDERRNAVRETYWQHIAFDKKFFFGTAPAQYDPLADEVFLDVPDAFRFHCAKNQAMFRWALAHGYDYMFRVDDDAFVFPDRLAEASQVLNADQIGFAPTLAGNNYITGGAGFWASRKVMQAVVDAPLTKTHEDDLWIGRDVYQRSGWTRRIDERYRPAGTAHFADLNAIPKDTITLHSVRPPDMYRLYERWKSE